MANEKPDVTEVKSLIGKRLTHLGKVKKTLTLGTSQADLVIKSFVDSMSAFTAITGGLNMNFVKGSLEAIQKTSLAPIPVSEIEGNPAIAVMHNKFKNLTAAIFSDSYMPDFLRNIIKLGCDNTINSGNGFITNMAGLVSSIDSHAAEIANYLNVIKDAPEKDMPRKIAENGPAIVSSAQGLYLSTVKLFNSVKNTNAVSAELSNTIMSQADELVNLMGTEGSANPAISRVNVQEYLKTVSTIDDQINGLKQYGENLKTFKEEFSNLDVNKLLNDNFKNILSNGSQVITMANHAVNAAKSGNISALTQSVKSIMGQVTYLKGQVGQLSVSSLKDVFASDLPLLNDFNNLKAQAENFVNNFPNEILRSFKADINAVVGMTDNLLKSVGLTNSGKRPSASDILSIAGRIGTKSNAIISHTSDFISAVSTFKGSENDKAATALSALKAVAPTPMEALAKGNVSTFKKSLDNPMLLTKIGACQEEISKAMQIASLTAQELSKLNTLLSFVNGEAEREMMTNFVSDLDLQNSMAITGIDDIVTDTVMPMQRTLEQFIKMTGMDEA